MFVDVPTKRKIRHKAAITVHKQCELLLIAALCFILCRRYINERGQFLVFLKLEICFSYFLSTVCSFILAA